MKLFEIRDRTKTKTQTAGPDLSAFDRAFADQVRGTQDLPAQRQDTRAPERRTATGGQTRARATGIDMGPEAGEKLSFLDRLGIQDEISDEEAAERAGVNMWDDDHHDVSHDEPEAPTQQLARIENMPAVIGKQMTDTDSINPEWHQVKHLPGYLKSPIRAMGRQIFGTYTKTPIEDIQVLAHVGGKGPNTEDEVKAVATWLLKHGQKDTDGEMNFQQSIPDYNADFAIYKRDGYTFMVVKDFAGHYIYSWPSADEHSEGAEGAAVGVDRRRLR